MNIKKTDKYTYLKIENQSILEFSKEIENQFSNYRGEHLIIDIFQNINIKSEDLSLLLTLGRLHIKNGTSFVIVSNSIEYDELQNDISVVPTFNEALDILEMEAIERDLGF